MGRGRRYRSGVLVSLPEPFDFRVFGAREVRIRAAAGGVDIDPNDPPVRAFAVRFSPHESLAAHDLLVGLRVLLR